MDHSCVSLIRWLLWCALLLASLAAFAASPEEERIYDAAAKAFNDGLLERADRELGEFIRLYPSSERFNQAVLYQAQARFKLGLYDQALQSLQANLDRASTLADQYRFWIAESYFYRSNYSAAAAAYAQLVKDFSESSLRPKAIFGQALACFRLGDLTNTLTLLKLPEGPFQTLAKAHPELEYVQRGNLLLAETLLQLKDGAGSEQVLNSLQGGQLSPELEWQRQSLLVRTKLASQHPEAALAHVTNLLTLAESPLLRPRTPEAVSWRGEILQRLQQVEPAIAAFQLNLGEQVSSDYRRQAYLKIIELNMARNRPDQAVLFMTQLIKSFSQDPAMDQWLLKLGQFYLAQLDQLPAASGRTNEAEILSARTNLVQLSQTQFDQIITQFTNSPLIGKAYLNRGWCLSKSDRLPESLAAFRTAAGLLPSSEDLIYALLNWADTQCQLRDWAGAATNYQALIARPDAAQLAPDLVHQAQFQLVRVNVERQQADQAKDSLDDLLQRAPKYPKADQAMLLVAQLLNRLGKPVDARKILENLIERYAQSPLIPEARLAIARSYSSEPTWDQALTLWDQWVQVYSNHPALLPQAEFYRAWSYDQAGQGSNALVLFTNFVARFPTNPLAPLAQNWIGDYYYNQGQFPKAEENYQILYQKWPLSELTYPAKLKAGQSALLRQGFDDAIGYFTNLINDALCPADVVASAFFSFGDVLMSKPTTNLTARYEAAIIAFGKIPQNYPTNRLVPLAWGKIGDCYFQLAAQDTNQYRNASQFYNRVLDSKQATWASRCQAEIGLGLIDEKLAQLRPGPEQAALLTSAQDHYANVLYEKTRRPSEPRDPFWLEEAGLKAARLAELGHRWQEAASLYSRLKELLPALGPMLDAKRDAALQQANP